MHSIESGTRISVALFLSLSFTPDSMDNCNSSSMPKEKTKQAISLPMDKDTKTATSLPMLKEEIKLVPCVMCLQLPGTKTDFSHWFREMAKYECSGCSEMRAMFEPPSDRSSSNSYVGSDEEDHGSDPERTCTRN